MIRRSTGEYWAFVVLAFGMIVGLGWFLASHANEFREQRKALIREAVREEIGPRRR